MNLVHDCETGNNLRSKKLFIVLNYSVSDV